MGKCSELKYTYKYYSYFLQEININTFIYRDPTPDESLGVKWNPYTVDKENYLDIGNDLQTGSAPDRDEFLFWENIFKEFIPEYVDRVY